MGTIGVGARPISGSPGAHGFQTLKAAPQGVEVGADAVLVSTLGIGVVFGQAQNVLAMYDPVNQQMLDVTVPALSTTPAPLPATTLTRPVLTFTGRLLRTL